MTLVEELLYWPVISAPIVADVLGVTPQGARLVIERLRVAGILTTLHPGRPQLYAAQEILDLLE